jgi:YaiO family outer membrane protein
MTRTVPVVLLGLALVGRGATAAQQWRVAAWGSYDGVTAAPDWRGYGGQLTWTARGGHAMWGAAEIVERFGLRDVAERLGVALHPHPRWWLSLEAGTASRPEVVPKNSWEVDVTTRVGAAASAGAAYRRQNYVAGAVDVVMPHGTVMAGGVTWEGRLYLSRNPSGRNDLAGFLRATRRLSPRVECWAGGGAGRESYLVGAPPQQTVEALRTATATLGGRAELGGRAALRVDLTVVKSEPVLSRRGVAAALERRF